MLLAEILFKILPIQDIKRYLNHALTPTKIQHILKTGHFYRTRQQVLSTEFEYSLKLALTDTHREAFVKAKYARKGFHHHIMSELQVGGLGTNLTARKGRPHCTSTELQAHTRVCVFLSDEGLERILLVLVWERLDCGCALR